MAEKISLESFFEKDLKRYSDELLYLRAVKFCREAPPEMRGPLYYALLNWKDCHSEIQKRCIELSKSYEVRWTEKDKPFERRKRSFYAIYSDTYKEDARAVYESIKRSENTKNVEIIFNPIIDIFTYSYMTQPFMEENINESH